MSKTWYDKRTIARTFEVGQKVLVLLPVPGKPLHAKFYGPYTIVQKLGDVDYVVATPDRRKTSRVCHINLLKAYHERDTTLFPDPHQSQVQTILAVECESETSMPVLPSRAGEVQSVAVATQLSTSQQAQLDAMLSEFSDVFSNTPGKTTLS